MNISLSAQIFRTINAKFCTFFTILCIDMTRMARKIAILASGNGTNAEAIIRYFQERGTARVVLVLTNRPTAPVLQRARGLDVPARCFTKEEWADGGPVLDCLRQHEVDFVVLAGFLLRIPAHLVQAYARRMVNIHPSLLPKFGGKGMYGDRVHEAVLAAGETESGITIHYTDEHYDEGTVICQYRCPVMPGDTPATLAARVHELEYAHYPRVIEELVQALTPAP